MSKNTLYEVLEVSENASAEVIEKAYKVLAKKYHPDLQSEANKKSAENKMKKINEAYDVLGNEEKRKEYDKALEQEREEQRLKQEMELERQRIEKEQANQASYMNGYNSADNINSDEMQEQRLKYEKKLRKEEMQQRKKMQENLNREYENAYYNYLRSLGYKVKRRITKERVRDFFITIGVMVLIITALWFIPPTHDWLVSFYEENPILKAIIDVIVSVITGIFSGIWEFITGLFT